MKLTITLEDKDGQIVERKFQIKMIGKKDAIIPDVTEEVFDMINTLVDSKKPL